MDEEKKVVRTAVIILFVLLVIVDAYYFFIAGKGKTKGGPGSALRTEEFPEDAVVTEGKDLAALSIELDKSDETVRNLIGELSSNSTFAQWLKNKDLVRKFVAAVDNIANGQSPRPQMDFFTPFGGFTTLVKSGQIYIDPSSYDRYNIVADVFDSVSTAGCARLYGSFRPLFQQAYRELGYPKEDFHMTVLRAIVEILKTPVVDEAIALEKSVTTYAMRDLKLEELSPAQKHLLRMGPENLQLIQAKLREVALALGFAESQLPQQNIYTSGRQKS
jgi:hypothetical protein